MSAQPKYALGREHKIYVQAETTYGAAAAAAAATDALRFRTASFSQKEDRVTRGDRRPTRSAMKRIVRRMDVDWQINGYLMPGGALGVAPDGWDAILAAAFGTETINASTSVVYTLAKEFEKSLTFHSVYGNALSVGVLGEMIRGAVVSQLQFSFSGAEETMITATGFAADSLRAGKSLVVSDNGTVVNVTAGDGAKFQAGQYIDVGTARNVLISSISTDALTCAAHAAGTLNDVVAPAACVTSATYVSTADAISGILGSCTLGGSAFEIVSGSITLDTGAAKHNDKFGSNKTNGFHQNNRDVKVSLTFRLNEDNFLALSKCRDITTRALTIVSGTTAGLIATFSLPAVEFNLQALPSTPDSDLLVTIEGVALGSSGEDEISLTLT